MNQEQMLRKLREAELPYYNAKAMYNEINHEEYLRKGAEDAYVLWLRKNNPDSIKYKYPNNPNDYEKFMWIEGYLANRRGNR